MIDIKELPLPTLQACHSGGLCFFTDEALSASCGVRIAFTTRAGGCSTEPYASLNLGLHVGDEAPSVESSTKILLEAMHGSADTRAFRLNQVHGTDILHVVASNQGGQQAGIVKQESGNAGVDLPVGFAQEVFAADAVSSTFAGDFDAVVVDADVCDYAPILCFADCMPIIMAAPNGAFAIAHAGWRGAFGRIAQKTARALAYVAQCDISAINIYIGPYIHAECFEVSPDLRQKFINEFGEGVGCINSAKPHVDLGAAVRLQLADAGVDSARICDIDLCTVCNSDVFFSYRASGGVCGRHGAVAFRRCSE